MAHAVIDSLSQDSGRFLDISGRAPHQLVALSSCQLHGAVAHAAHGHRCVRQREAAGETDWLKHFFLLVLWWRVSPSSRCAARDELLERLSYQPFALLPERLGGSWIHRITAHSLGHSAGGNFVRDDQAYLAVLAI